MEPSALNVSGWSVALGRRSWPRLSLGIISYDNICWTRAVWKELVFPKHKLERHYRFSMCESCVHGEREMHVNQSYLSASVSLGTRLKENMSSAETSLDGSQRLCLSGELYCSSAFLT